ncbi:MAG TPA: tetratricopeptide repeat protein [Opitutaceae bacterium]|nr:tetratricopeptide repeat protein [Opitutaceae bacterium]
MRIPSRTVLFLVASAGLTLVTGCSRHSRMERHLNQGIRFAEAGDFQKAELEYRTALQLVPGESTVMGRIAMLYYADGRLVPAYLMFQDVLKAEPKNTEFRLTFGLISLSLARTVEARTAAKEVLDADPGNEDALLLLAESSITPRDFAESRDLIRHCQQRTKDNSGIHVALGELKFEQGDAVGAEAEFHEAISLNPKSSAAYAELGSIYLSRHDTDAARKALKTAADLSPLRGPRRMKYIDFLVRQGDTAEAKHELALITDKAPDFIPAWLMSMRLAFAARQYADCDAIIDKILEHDLINYDALMERAAIRSINGDIDGSIAVLERVLVYYHNAPQVRYQLALAYLRKGDSARAEQNVNQAILVAPAYDDAILLLGDINLGNGDTTSVVADMRRLLKRNPRNVQAYVLLARALRAQGKLQDTLDVLRTLAAGTPNSPESAYLLGMGELDLGHTAEAQQQFAKSAKLKDDYWPAWEMLIEADVAGGRLNDATAEVKRLTTKYGRDAQPWLLDAKLKLLQKDAQGAESALLHAIKIDPSSQYAYLQLARIYYDKRQVPQAITELKALTAKSPNVTALMQLGILYTSIKRTDEAKTAYQELLDREPKFAPALNNLAVLEGTSDHALDLARQARELSPDDPVVADTLGWILARRRKFEGALPLLQVSADRLPTDAEIQYHLAMAYYLSGNEAAAERQLAVVLSVPGESPVKADAQACLAILRLDPATATPAQESELAARVTANPGDFVALCRLAAVERRRGAVKDAVAHYEAALKLNPRTVDVRRALVEIYVGPQPDPARALTLAKEAHQMAENDAQLSWDLGRLLFHAGNYDWSSTVLDQAARALPGHPELLFELAQARFAAGHLAEAEAKLKQALDAGLADPHRAAAVQLSTMVAGLNDPSRLANAVATAKTVLATDRSNLAASMVTAIDLEKQGKFDAARAAYERLLAHDDGFAPATRRLAILYAEQLGDDTKAERLAIKAREKYPDDPKLAYELGVINYRRGDYTKALGFLRQSARRSPDDPHTVLYLGLCHFQLKNLVESKTELRRSLELSLPAPEAAEARRVLDAMTAAPIGG